MRNYLILPFLLFSLCFQVWAAGGGGSAGGASVYDGNRLADYDIGEKIFFDDVICDTCPHANPILNDPQLAEILKDVGRDGRIGKDLTLKERRSVALFVKLRFDYKAP